MYKKAVLFKQCNNPKQMILLRRQSFRSQPVECINKLRSLYLLACSGFSLDQGQVCTLTALTGCSFLSEGDDIIVDALLLQLLQLLRCSLCVDRLRLRHGCIGHRCDS